MSIFLDLRQAKAATTFFVFLIGLLGLSIVQAQELQPAPTVPEGQLQLASPLDAVTKSGARATYLIQLKQEPAARYQGGLPGYPATAPEPGSKYDANAGHVQQYLSYLLGEQDDLLDSIGAGDQKIYGYCHTINGVAASLTPAEVDILRANENVLNVFADFAVDVDTNNSPEFLGLLDRRGGLRRDLGLKGEDVIVGILDSGAIQEHPSFADTETVCDDDDDDEERDDDDCETRLTYDAPPVGWNGVCQAGEAWSEADCNNKLIGARWFVDGFLAGRGSVVEDEFLSPRDSSGHGSHTASTAAGNVVNASLAGTPLAQISGIAPRARIAVYKVCWLSPGATNFSCFFSDSAAATEAAVADGVDVINFSVGTAASFTDTQDLAFLDATAAGVFVARSAGNDGPGFQTTNAGEPWVTSVGASTLDGIGFALAATVNSPASVAGDYAALEGAITRPLIETGPVTDNLVAANPVDACTPLTNSINGIALIARGTCAFVTKVENAVIAGASAVLMYTDSRPKTVMGGTATPLTQSVPGVMIDNAPGLALLAELNASNTVSVTLAAGNFITEQLNGNIMADFSSRGPFVTEGDWIKPDVTAPGVRILAASTPEPSDGSAGDLFAYLQGTSMSSPHVAGLAALLVEAHPDWSPAQVKSALMTTGRQNVVKEDGVTPADPFDFGGGHVDPNKAVNPGLTYDAGILDYLAASCGTVTPLLSGADCDFVETALGLSLDPADLNLASIGIAELPGTKTVTRTVTAVNSFKRNDDDDDDDDDEEGDEDGDDDDDNRARATSYTAQISAPPGFDVSVSPNQLNLRPGESASYDVTVTNVTASPGEWLFGSLTWNGDNGQTARSPIAVNAVAIVAPPEISGTGANGTDDFDITFGYNGNYTAGIHGLNDAGLFLSTVTDDPFDSFAFFGPGTALAFVGEMPSGTAIARWATFNEYTTGTNDDIDLYLFYCPNFSCTQIASSGNSDSNEEVTVEFPVNDPSIADPYVIFVHGFNTDAGLPSDVILFNWTVGIVDDPGNLTVVAPTTATLGDTETVTVNWNGLNTGLGFKQLGAVSHSDDSGIQDFTLINIANDPGGSICLLPGFICR